MYHRVGSRLASLFPWSHECCWDGQFMDQNVCLFRYNVFWEASHDWRSFLLALSMWASHWSLHFLFGSNSDSLLWHSKYQLCLEVCRSLTTIIMMASFWSFSQDGLLQFNGKWPSSLSLLTLQRTKASNISYFCSTQVTLGPKTYGIFLLVY